MSNPKNENESAINAEEELIIDAEVDSEVLEEAASEAESPEAAEAAEEAVELADMSKAELFKDAENAREEAAKFRDAALRAEAEMQNVRRRASKDVEHAHKFGAEKLIQNLLPVVDSLEKALESSELVKDLDQDHSAKAVLDGVGLCHKMFLDTLGKENVAVVDPHGEPFDPNLHQAMSMVENPDMEPNTVMDVFQKGYTLNGRLVRPAMVVVSSAP